MATSCEAPLEKCYGNPECAALIDCVSVCNGNQTCQTQCVNMHFGGALDGQALNQCVQNNCTGKCP